MTKTSVINTLSFCLKLSWCSVCVKDRSYFEMSGPPVDFCILSIIAIMLEETLSKVLCLELPSDSLPTQVVI